LYGVIYACIKDVGNGAADTLPYATFDAKLKELTAKTPQG